MDKPNLDVVQALDKIFNMVGHKFLKSATVLQDVVQALDKILVKAGHVVGHKFLKGVPVIQDVVQAVHEGRGKI